MDESTIDSSGQRRDTNDKLAKPPSSSPFSDGTHNGGLASHASASAQGLVKAEVGKHTHKSAADLGSVAAALRESTKELKDNMVAPYIEKAADQIDRASEFLRNGDLRQAQRSVEDYARREPLLFLGGAFALGLLGARFIKSSSPSESAS